MTHTASGESETQSRFRTLPPGEAGAVTDFRSRSPAPDDRIRAAAGLTDLQAFLSAMRPAKPVRQTMYTRCQEQRDVRKNTFAAVQRGTVFTIGHVMATPRSRIRNKALIRRVQPLITAPGREHAF